MASPSENNAPAKTVWYKTTTTSIQRVYSNVCSAGSKGTFALSDGLVFRWTGSVWDVISCLGDHNSFIAVDDEGVLFVAALQADSTVLKKCFWETETIVPLATLDYPISYLTARGKSEQQSSTPLFLIAGNAEELHIYNQQEDNWTTIPLATDMTELLDTEGVRVENTSRPQMLLYVLAADNNLWVQYFDWNDVTYRSRSVHAWLNVGSSYNLPNSKNAVTINGNHFDRLYYTTDQQEVYHLQQPNCVLQEYGAFTQLDISSTQGIRWGIAEEGSIYRALHTIDPYQITCTVDGKTYYLVLNRVTSRSNFVLEWTTQPKPNQDKWQLVVFDVNTANNGSDDLTILKVALQNNQDTGKSYQVGALNAFKKKMLETYLVFGAEVESQHRFFELTNVDQTSILEINSGVNFKGFLAQYDTGLMLTAPVGKYKNNQTGNYYAIAKTISSSDHPVFNFVHMKQ